MVGIGSEIVGWICVVSRMRVAVASFASMARLMCADFMRQNWGLVHATVYAQDRTAQMQATEEFDLSSLSARRAAAMRTVLAAIVVSSGVSPALSHSWYDARCCSGSDCHPVPCEQIRRDADGRVTFVPTGVQFFKENVLQSQDSQCHICTSRPQTNAGYGYCAYLPRAGEVW